MSTYSVPGQGISSGLGYGTAQVGVAPLAPLLLYPATNSAVDVTDTTWTWLFASPLGIGQGAYAIRFMLPSVGAWMYWSGSSLQTAEYWISSGTSSSTITAGLANGNLYAWQVATKDANGMIGPYSRTSFVTGSPIPVVTVTGPTGTLTVGNQTLTWVNSDVAQVQTWQVIVYTAAQFGAGGFSPGSSPYVWSSGVNAGSVSSATLPALPTGTFYAYVQIAGPFGETSDWSYLELVYSYSAPEQPTLSATYDTSNNTVALVVTGHDTGGLVGETTATVFRSLDGGSTWTAVSTFTNLAVPADDQVVDGTDPTPSASQTEGSLPTTSYYAVITGPSGITSIPSATETVTPSFPTGSFGWTFLYSAAGGTYNTTLQPMITTMTQTQPVRGGLHLILGDPEPLYLLDVVGSRTLKLTAVTVAVDDWVALRAFLQGAAVNCYVTNVYGLVGFFMVTPDGYSTEQAPGSTVSTLRTTTFELVETATLPTEGAGT